MKKYSTILLAILSWVAAFNLYRLANNDEDRNLIFGIFLAITIFLLSYRVNRLSKDLIEKHLCEWICFICFYNVVDEYFKIYEKVVLSEYFIAILAGIVFYVKYKYKLKWTTKFKTH